MKERVGISAMANPETKLFFDPEHMTTAEEVLKTHMEEVLIKREGQENPFTDVLESHIEDEELIYLNDKEQLLKIVKKKKDNGSVVDIHNIIAFDVRKLPQAIHTYQNDEELNFAVRAKVPVKDGRSQNVSSTLLIFVEIHGGNQANQKHGRKCQ
jgi:hypothetical protein